MNSEIQALLNKNTMSDLKRFIKQRQTLNSANWYLKYFFHSVQAAGLLTTSNVAELTNLYYTNARVYANVTERLSNLNISIIPAVSEIYSLGSLTNKFKIHVGKIRDYKIQFNQLADIIGKNDNVKQMVINDTWNSPTKGYREMDYAGSQGIGNLKMDEANPGEFFKQMASDFLTNTVADLKNIGVSKLQGALLGNIYGLGGINLASAGRSAFSAINTFPLRFPLL